jgi:FAD/FMN-containing dehydrogenase
MRSLVAGVEAVLPDGEIFDGLTALKKDNRGFDLRQLFIGAEGTIGVVTAATLRTVPALVDRAVAWVGVRSPQAAYRLFRLIEQKSGGRLEGFEILPDECLRNVLEHIDGTSDPLPERHAWHALVELVRERAEEESPDELATRLLGDALEEGLIDNAVLAQSESQAEAFWKLRETISEAERAEGPAVQHDISVPVAKMADFISEEGAAIERRWPGTRVAAFGHMGDGNVHLHVKAPNGVDGDQWYQDDGKRISREVYEAVTAASGSISAEHGIGQDKIAELDRLSDPVRLAMLRAVKRAFDPDDIMNPGKLVPLASGEPSA